MGSATATEDSAKGTFMKVQGHKRNGQDSVFDILSICRIKVRHEIWRAHFVGYYSRETSLGLTTPWYVTSSLLEWREVLFGINLRSMESSD